MVNQRRRYRTRQREREEAADEEAIADIRRERDKMHQRNSRLARKYGLKGRRKRG